MNSNEKEKGCPKEHSIVECPLHDVHELKSMPYMQRPHSKNAGGHG